MKKMLFLAFIASMAVGGETIVLKEGWNLVSSPFAEKSVPISIFGENIKSKWAFENSGWKSPDTLTPGVGVWLKVDSTLYAITSSSTEVAAPKRAEINQMMQDSADNAWNLLGAPVLLGSNELKSKGAKTFWLYDENEAAWKSEATVQVGRGFWIYKEASLGYSGELLQSSTFVSAVDTILLGSSAGAIAADKGGSSGETVKSTSELLSGRLQSTRNQVSLVKIASNGIVSKGGRDYALDATKAAMLSGIVSLPEPQKSQYTEKINSAISSAELQSIQAELASLQSSAGVQSSSSSIAAISIPSEQLAMIEPVLAYLDEETKGWYGAIKSGTVPTSGFNEVAFESRVKNGYVQKMYDDMKSGSSQYYIPGKFENGTMILDETENNQSVRIKIRFYTLEGVQITENLDNPKSFVWFEDNGTNVAPLKEFIKDDVPDFAKMRAKADVEFPKGFVMGGSTVYFKKMESEFFAVPLSDKELPKKLFFSGEGEIDLSGGEKWTQKNIKMYVHNINSGSAKAVKKIEGSYEIEKRLDGKNIKGIAEFDSSGCRGAEISVDGKYAGKIVLQEGILYAEKADGTKEKAEFSFK